MLFATLSLGLALLPFAVGQQVHDIQVGSANGTLAFTPEAIVCIFFLFCFSESHEICHKTTERPTW